MGSGLSESESERPLDSAIGAGVVFVAGRPTDGDVVDAGLAQAQGFERAGSARAGGTLVDGWACAHSVPSPAAIYSSRYFDSGVETTLGHDLPGGSEGLQGSV